MKLASVARICGDLAATALATFREAVQSVWFLFVILHMESNASSFSPGRVDQYLSRYYKAGRGVPGPGPAGAPWRLSAFWLKFNQIVYLRNSHSAKYFAGFPIGFNVALGGQDDAGQDASNELSFLFLRAQAQIGLPQPNLSARLSEKSSEDVLRRVRAGHRAGVGMPQVFNDESIIPALNGARHISPRTRWNYAIVGCVELTTHGNALGWSDAAMFNMVKALELTINNGMCLLTREAHGAGPRLARRLQELRGAGDRFPRADGSFHRAHDQGLRHGGAGCTRRCSHRRSFRPSSTAARRRAST